MQANTQACAGLCKLADQRSIVHFDDFGAIQSSTTKNRTQIDDRVLSRILKSAHRSESNYVFDDDLSGIALHKALQCIKKSPNLDQTLCEACQRLVAVFRTVLRRLRFRLWESRPAPTDPLTADNVADQTAADAFTRVDEALSYAALRAQISETLIRHGTAPVRAEAFILESEGTETSCICTALIQLFGVEIKPDTVRQWRKRYFAQYREILGPYRGQMLGGVA